LIAKSSYERIQKPLPFPTDFDYETASDCYDWLHNFSAIWLLRWMYIGHKANVTGPLAASCKNDMHANYTKDVSLDVEDAAIHCLNI